MLPHLASLTQIDPLMSHKAWSFEIHLINQIKRPISIDNCRLEIAPI